MAAFTWEIDRDIHLARFLGDTDGLAKAEQDLEAAQASCQHVENPERSGRCYKCGAGMVRPGLVKTRSKPLDVRKVG